MAVGEGKEELLRSLAPQALGLSPSVHLVPCRGARRNRCGHRILAPWQPEAFGVGHHLASVRSPRLPSCGNADCSGIANQYGVVGRTESVQLEVDVVLDSSASSCEVRVSSSASGK